LVEALGYDAETAGSGQAALARLAQPPRPDLVVIDVVMPELDGVETLRRYRAGGGKAPVIMCSALDEADTVVRAMRAGATDYVTKPFNPDELREILERAAGSSGKAAALPTPKQSERPSLGLSPSMRAIDELIERIADADVPVLLTGESGVGKDVVAREIHARSARTGRVFVKINCAALPAELLESELFGHERGSFTGAQKTKPGQFELADGGTLFLDEIGEMPVSMQAKLLQALQDGEFYRVGGQKKIKVDTRVIVATNVDLGKAMARGTFREDLYYRLNVVEVAIPPLRERRDDIPRLLEHFLDKYGKRYQRPMDAVPPEVFQRLIAYDYPGNIRELENLVRRLIVLRDPRYILGELQTRPANAPSAPPLDPATTQSSGQLLPFPNEPSPYTNPSFTRPPPQPQQAVAPSQPMTYGYAPAPAPGSQPGMMTVSVPYETPNAPPGQIDDEYRIDLKDLGRKAANAAEREAIVIMLRHTGGNKREAAERLGISYKAILYKIREFGIGRPRNRRPAPLPAAAASLEADAVDALGDDDLDADDRPTTLSGTVNAAVGSIG
ncbi:MAG TPA: sigma 54-interacting transcriptional regulator, partial [Polyangia bacterium]|nr:sigma 54-interacting transcriptional regulator [Polyangia bacterium]